MPILRRYFYAASGRLGRRCFPARFGAAKRQNGETAAPVRRPQARGAGGRERGHDSPRAGAPPAKKGRGRAREREQDFPARLRAAYEGQFVGRTLSLVPEEQKEGFTVGYSENYIRIYVQGTLARKTDVRALRPFKDGLLAAPQ